MVAFVCNKCNKQLFKYLFYFLWECVLKQGQESDSSETSVRGPRIKHVCRRAAVALGRNRAVFPDDMPTLSALPWEEREKILSSMGNDGEAHLVYLCSPHLHVDHHIDGKIYQHYNWFCKMI